MEYATDEFRKTYYEDPLVHRAIRSGLDYQAIIVMMSERHKELTKTLVHLRSIAPFKISVDGVTKIWRCPNDLIPEEEVAK